MILTPAEAADLADRLFQLRCAAEDVATAVEERAPVTQLSGLVDAMLGAAREAERLR